MNFIWPSQNFSTHDWTSCSVYQQLSSSCWSQPDIMQQNWHHEKGHMTSNWDFFALHFFNFFSTQFYLQLLVAFVSKHLDEGTKSAVFCFNALLWSYNITVAWSFRILISQINFTRKLNLHNFWVVCLALGINKSVPWIYIMEKIQKSTQKWMCLCQKDTVIKLQHVFEWERRVWGLFSAGKLIWCEGTCGVCGDGTEQSSCLNSGGGHENRG